MASCPLVLASGSPRRRELLGALGLTFAVVPADVDEVELAAGLSPAAGAVRVARAKVRAAGHGAAVVLAADTIVTIDGRVLGKPADREEARAMLERLRGREHEVVTAVAVRRGEDERVVPRTSRVRMRRYAEDELRAYVDSDAGLDKAGAYGIQDDGFRPVEAVDGCWCNVMGLPLWTAFRMLARVGCTAPRTPDAVHERCALCPLADAEADLARPPG